MSLPIAAVTLAFLALFALLVFQLARLLREGLHEGGRLRLAEVFERRGARLDADLLDMPAAASATRRCTYCSAKDECDAWLASGRREGLARFCPNADFVARRSNR